MAREKKMYQVITFYTTTQAMAFEQKCNTNAIPGRIIPVPREISAGCGLAWRMLKEDYHTSLEWIQTSGLIFQDSVEILL